jgi:hypothetical protein
LFEHSDVWLLRSLGQIDRYCRDFVAFYNGHQPQSAYGGRTPDEVQQGRPAKMSCTQRLSFFDGRLRWWRFT